MEQPSGLPLDSRTVAYPYHLSCDLDSFVSVKISAISFPNVYHHSHRGPSSIQDLTPPPTRAASHVPSLALPVELFVSAKLYSQQEGKVIYIETCAANHPRDTNLPH